MKLTTLIEMLLIIASATILTIIITTPLTNYQLCGAMIELSAASLTIMLIELKRRNNMAYIKAKDKQAETTPETKPEEGYNALLTSIGNGAAREAEINLAILTELRLIRQALTPTTRETTPDDKAVKRAALEAELAKLQ